MATYRGGEPPVTPAEAAEFARHASVDVQLFRVFGVEPAIGRTLGPEDLVPDTGQPVAVISHAEVDRRRFTAQELAAARKVFAGLK